MTDINYFYKLYDLINIYYEENHDLNYNYSTYIYKFSHLSSSILISVVKFLSNYILFEDFKRPYRVNINTKLSHSHHTHNHQSHGSSHNHDKYFNSPNREEFFNLNYLHEFSTDEKYLTIFLHILEDLKNYVFWANHKSYIETLTKSQESHLNSFYNGLYGYIAPQSMVNKFYSNKKQSGIPQQGFQYNEKQIYIENFFFIKESVNKDLVVMKSMLWELFKNLIMIKFRKDFVIYLKKILNDFQKFLVNYQKLSNTNIANKTQPFEYNKIAKMFLADFYGFQLNRIEKLYKILNALNAIIYYDDIKPENLYYIDFDLLKENLLYALVILKNYEKVQLN